MTIIAIVSCDDLKRTDLKDISVFPPNVELFGQTTKFREPQYS